MLLGEEDDMVFPEKVGVVKGEDPFVLEVNWDNQLAGQDLAAIEITEKFSHELYFPPCRSASKAGLALERRW